MLICRPEAESGKQARLALRSHVQQYAHFDLRIDEEMDGSLSFDFGSLTQVSALQCARRFAEEGTMRHNLYAYSKLITIEGQLHRERCKDIASTFIMSPNRDDVSLSQRVSLMGIACAQMGIFIGIRKGGWRDSYHFKEYVTSAHAEGKFAFKDAVLGIRNLMIRS